MSRRHCCSLTRSPLNAQFQGLALTPDGHYPIAADLTDNSVAAINTDSPSDNFDISLSPAPSYPCPAGPLFVAADNEGQAYIVTGSQEGLTVQGSPCLTGGVDFIVNLSARTAAFLKNSGFNFSSGYVQASKDGSVVAFGGGPEQISGLQLFSPAQNVCLPVANPLERWAASWCSSDRCKYPHAYILAASAGLEDVTLTNPDGATYTLNNAVTIQ